VGCFVWTETEFGSGLVSRIVKKARVQVLMAASMKMAVFRLGAPCSLVEVYRRFRGVRSPSSRRSDDGGSKQPLKRLQTST
jgi:hypothetical protein